MVSEHAFLTLNAIQDGLLWPSSHLNKRKMVRSRFLSMRDYVQMALHLALCIIPHLVAMYTQVNVVVDKMREG